MKKKPKTDIGYKRVRKQEIPPDVRVEAEKVADKIGKIEPISRSDQFVRELSFLLLRPDLTFGVRKFLRVAYKAGFSLEDILRLLGVDNPNSEGCQSIEHPNVIPGWGCCNCRVYNNNARANCRGCDHLRCTDG